MIIEQHISDISTVTGSMRTYIYKPSAEGVYPTIIFYSEIFQQTAPIARTAAIMAGHGFVVLVPEVFHELNPIGTILSYDDEGKDKGNSDKATKLLEDHDSDTQAMVTFIEKQNYCSDAIGAMGVCIGGHLAYRAAFHPKVVAASCLYPTDIHSNTLPCIVGNDSFSQTKNMNAKLQMIFGKQDPHVPDAGRAAIYQNLLKHKVNFTWHEFNAQHAFMRDEGERYDPALALQVYSMAVAFFNETLT